MKTVINIEDFIKSLKEIENEIGDWILYPKVGGYSVNCSFFGKSVKINSKEYDLTNYMENKNIDSLNETTDVIIAPDGSCGWLKLNNLLLIENAN